MTNEEREIQRKLRVLQHAENIGNTRNERCCVDQLSPPPIDYTGRIYWISFARGERQPQTHHVVRCRHKFKHKKSLVQTFVVLSWQ